MGSMFPDSNQNSKKLTMSYQSKNKTTRPPIETLVTNMLVESSQVKLHEWLNEKNNQRSDWRINYPSSCLSFILPTPIHSSACLARFSIPYSLLVSGTGARETKETFRFTFINSIISFEGLLWWQDRATWYPLNSKADIPFDASLCLPFTSNFNHD